MLERWFSMIKLPLSLKHCSPPQRRFKSGLNGARFGVR